MACLEIEEQASLFFTSLISSSPDEVYFTIDCSKSYENLLSQIFTDIFYLCQSVAERKENGISIQIKRMLMTSLNHLKLSCNIKKKLSTP